MYVSLEDTHVTLLCKSFCCRTVCHLIRETIDGGKRKNSHIPLVSLRRLGMLLIMLRFLQQHGSHSIVSIVLIKVKLIGKAMFIDDMVEQAKVPLQLSSELHRLRSSLTDALSHQGGQDFGTHKDLRILPDMIISISGLGDSQEWFRLFGHFLLLNEDCRTIDGDRSRRGRMKRFINRRFGYCSPP